ncbi:MAG: hypothetical protein GX491_19280 [Chloroflexi bacterium]|nr:hypothetical protein [Chloroflexota bacterium]
MTRSQKLLLTLSIIAALCLLGLLVIDLLFRPIVTQIRPTPSFEATETLGIPISEATTTPDLSTTSPTPSPSEVTPSATTTGTEEPSSTLITPTPAPTTEEPTPEATSTPEEAEADDEGTNEFFVSPDGSKENDGTKEEPWELQYALNHPSRVKPGDTIWLLGGEYNDSYTLRLEGEEGRPITVRAYPGERAILTNDDRVLDISTSRYVNLWGLEIRPTENSRDPEDYDESAYGVRVNQGKESHHIKFINMIVHDMPSQGFGWWQANQESEIYGSLIFFNGVTQFDHGIYVNNDTGQKRIVDNFIFDNASHGIHAYGEKEHHNLNNIHIEGNTLFNNGSIGFSTTQGTYGIYKRNILLGGLMVAENPVIINNYTYYPGDAGEALNLGYKAGSSGAIVENNYFAGGQIEIGGENPGLAITQNTIAGGGIASLASTLRLGQNQVLLARPNGLKVFIRPNQYEAGRANITIYNWSHQETVTLTANDLEGVDLKPGDRYELHNVQDYFEDVITGTFDGNRLVIPMTGHTVAQPIGLDFKPNTTFPEFGAFVLIRIDEDNSDG